MKVTIYQMSNEFSIEVSKNTNETRVWKFRYPDAMEELTEVFKYAGIQDVEFEEVY
jgi:hypothetical protein